MLLHSLGEKFRAAGDTVMALGILRRAVLHAAYPISASHLDSILRAQVSSRAYITTPQPSFYPLKPHLISRIHSLPLTTKFTPRDCYMHTFSLPWVRLWKRAERPWRSAKLFTVAFWSVQLLGWGFEPALSRFKVSGVALRRRQ